MGKLFHYNRSEDELRGALKDKGLSEEEIKEIVKTSKRSDVNYLRALFSKEQWAYAFHSDPRGAYWLIAVNIFPVFGVLFLGWDLFSILFLYWAENIAIGFYNFLKILKAKKPSIASKGTSFNNAYKTVKALFFVFHYGMFTVGHGMSIFTLFGSSGNLKLASAAIGLAMFFISHGVSYFKNFIGKKEYLKTSPDEQMMVPYKRVFVMHFTIIFGAFVLGFIGAPIGALLILIVLKTSIDLLSHSKEHAPYLAKP